MGVGRDGLLPGEHLLHIAVHLAVHRRAVGEKRPRLLPHEARVSYRHRYGDQRHENEQRADEEHHEEGAHDRHDRGHDLHKVRGKGGADDIDVVGDAADDVSCLVAVEISHRHPHQLVEYVLAHLLPEKAAYAHHDYRDGVA